MNTFKTRVEYEITDASVKTYSFPFPYLRKEFIKVSILHKDNTITALTYGVDYSVADLSITLVTAPSVSEHLIIYRETTTDRIITWNDGSILLAKDMNTEDAQMLHLQEEQQDYLTANALATSVTSDKETIWSALNHRITNVFDPKEPQDAVTKHYMETVQGGFVSQNTALVEQATTQATNAKTSEDNASSYAVSAYNSVVKSQAWAESEESPNGEDDSLSTTGKTKSAKGWAEQAKIYAGALNLSYIVDTILPVGIIIEFTNNTDPNELYQGTKWDKMDGGRVLVSAGTYTESGTTYTYNLGDTGGEAKHQLTTGELANHDHDISISTTNLDGYLSTENTYKNSGPGHRDGGGIVQVENIYDAYRGNGDSDNGNYMGRDLHIAASHDHNATISTAGNNQVHENRMPYTVINRWKRTA